MEVKNVRQRRDGLLEKRVIINGEKKYIYGKTINDIIKKEEKLDLDVRRGYDTALRNLSLCEYYQHWYNVEIKDRIAPATEFNYDYCYRCLIKPFFKNEKIVKINKDRIDEFRREIYKKYSHATMRCVMNYFKRMFDFAIVEGVVTCNPVLQLRPLRKKEQVKITDTVHRALTLEEETLFFNYCKKMEEWHYESMLFSMATGVRIGELKGLKWKDIDYDNNKIVISRSYVTPPRYKGYEKEPKTKAGFRDIPLNTLSIEALNSQKIKMKKYFGDNAIEPESYVFRNRKGGVPDSEDFGNAINKICSEIEKKEGIIIPHFSHHAFRNTFATRFIENGGTLQTLKTILGHSTYRLTADLYVHVLPNTKKDEMDAFDMYVSEIS